jgi:hypothetical protein
MTYHNSLAGRWRDAAVQVAYVDGDKPMSNRSGHSKLGEREDLIRFLMLERWPNGKLPRRLGRAGACELILALHDFIPDDSKN